MGCWGITAFESDTGLDALDFFRRNMPAGGTLELSTLIQRLRHNERHVLEAVEDGCSHTWPMALAEVVAHFLDGDAVELDNVAQEGENRKFAAITSFTAAKDDLQWLRTYLADTLHRARYYAASSEGWARKWNGWFDEENWKNWQAHMGGLVRRLDILLNSPEASVQLVKPMKEQEESDSPVARFLRKGMGRIYTDCPENEVKVLDMVRESGALEVDYLPRDLVATFTPNSVAELVDTGKCRLNLDKLVQLCGEQSIPVCYLRSQPYTDEPEPQDLADLVKMFADKDICKKASAHRYLIGSFSDGDVAIENRPSAIAEFICTTGRRENLVISTPVGQKVLNTFGVFVDRCVDPEFMEALRVELIPRQQEIERELGIRM